MSERVKTGVVIVAAGSGSRMGGGVPKQFRMLAGKPVYRHSLDAFLKSGVADEVVLVVGADFVESVREDLAAGGYAVCDAGTDAGSAAKAGCDVCDAGMNADAASKDGYAVCDAGASSAADPAKGAGPAVTVVPGGATRAASVRSGLAALAVDSRIALIHDGARPFITTDLIIRVADAATTTGAAVPGIHPKDTVRTAGAPDVPSATTTTPTGAPDASSATTTTPTGAPHIPSADSDACAATETGAAVPGIHPKDTVRTAGAPDASSATTTTPTDASHIPSANSDAGAPAKTGAAVPGIHPTDTVRTAGVPDAPSATTTTPTGVPRVPRTDTNATTTTPTGAPHIPSADSDACAATETGAAVPGIPPKDTVRTAGIPDVPSATTDAATTTGVAIPGIHPKDTVRTAGIPNVPSATADTPTPTGTTLDRTQLYLVQTPQGFDKDLLISAYEKADETGFVGTDDASYVEQLGHPITVVEGDIANNKITTPEDMPMNIRNGIGFDVHKFAEAPAGAAAAVAAAIRGVSDGVAASAKAIQSSGAGVVTSDKAAASAVVPEPETIASTAVVPEPEAIASTAVVPEPETIASTAIIIGGVAIPYERPLLAHSDGDVLTHAVMDALLGAAGLGDIGELFPDTDEAYRGADSIALLREVAMRLSEADYTVLNIDATIMGEEPKFSPYKKQMAANLAGALGIESGQVNVKATTTEKLGFTGRKEGLAAQAVATITGP